MTIAGWKSDSTFATGKPGVSERDRLMGLMDPWPGFCTGGVMREASGTRSLSSMAPEPFGSWPSTITGVPGMYRWPTTMGKRSWKVPWS